jgi:hypothetical protein
MKSILALAVVTFMTVSKSSACVIFEPAAVTDVKRVQTVLSSESFTKELSKQVKKAGKEFSLEIRAIEVNDTVDVYLNNDCVIKNEFKYKKQDYPAACPMFKEIKAKTSCQK